MLYDRDYRILTEAEKAKWQKVESWFERVKGKDNSITAAQLCKYWDDLPKAVVFHKTLFPNNYLDLDEHDDTDRTHRIIESFNGLIDKKVSEREILKFVKEEASYFLIADALFPRFSTGHHGAYLFKEFQLPPNHIADYLLVGKNSGGYEFIFVELENSHGDITTKSGDFGITIRKGLKQIEEWSTWIDAHFSHLKLVFEKSKGTTEMLPNEFFELDKSRIHFAIIAGRRNDYTEKTYRLTRKHRKAGICILHYDNLIDGSNLKRTEALKLKERDLKNKVLKITI